MRRWRLCLHCVQLPVPMLLGIESLTLTPWVEQSKLCVACTDAGPELPPALSLCWQIISAACQHASCVAAPSHQLLSHACALRTSTCLNNTSSCPNSTGSRQQPAPPAPQYPAVYRPTDHQGYMARATGALADPGAAGVQHKGAAAAQLAWTGRGQQEEVTAAVNRAAQGLRHDQQHGPAKPELQGVLPLLRCCSRSGAGSTQKSHCHAFCGHCCLDHLAPALQPLLHAL